MALPNRDLLVQIDALAMAAPEHAQVFGYAREGRTVIPLFAWVLPKDNSPYVVVSAGVHGDEPEGVVALVRLLGDGQTLPKSTLPCSLIVLPCLNPTGLMRGTRANADGQDINRQFHADVTAETSAVRTLLSTRTLLSIIDLHTDARAEGFYFFELLQPGVNGVAEAVQSDLTARGIPLEPQPDYGGFVGARGLIAPSPATIARYEHRAPGASLSEWGWQRRVPRTYVLETPRTQGEQRGADMHACALLSLLSHLLEPGISGGALTDETRPAEDQ